MNSTTDPLLALQQTIKSQIPITYSKDSEPSTSLLSATHLVLSPSLSILKSTPTRYRKPNTSSNDPASTPQDFASIEAVYLAWHLRDAPGAEYMKLARESGLAVGFVSVTERKSLVEWLEGKLATHERIASLVVDSTTPPGSPLLKPSASTPSATLGSVEQTISPTKRRYVADSQDVEVVKKITQNEVELRDRNTVLRGTKANNFSTIRSAYTEKLKKLRDPKANAVTPAAPPSADPKAGKKSRNTDPIIMISSSPTALITMHNVKRFLAEAVFEPSQDARARATADGNSRPEDVIPIYRKRTHIDASGRETESQARYFVVDSVEALGKFGADAWDRVVCVMTTGQAWQFRPYKWNEPRQLFHHVKGIYVTWSNDPPNTKIKDWNVTELKVDPHRRHVDKSVVAHFWKTLDTWTIHNKPWLLKQ